MTRASLRSGPRWASASLFTLGLLLVPDAGPAAAQDAAPAAPADSTEPTLADTVRPGRFDNGKMWTFEHPPVEYFQEAYGMEADSSWFRRARLGALRVPNCTASFVSPSGLVMTNHHCARDAVSSVTREGEQLVDDGFYAATLADERPVDDYYAKQLREIIDVTDRVDGALEGVQGDAARSAARDSVTDALAEEMAEERGGEAAGAVVEVISLYNGAQYSAYVFHRYDDVRLVLSPELALGHFGGDPDNFTYPRYSLDMSFFRVYGDDGEPLETEHWFPWSATGAEEGDVVFVVGNPGSTSRLQTVAQLELRRDALDPATLNFFESRAQAYEIFLRENPDGDPDGALRNNHLAALNQLKSQRGMLEGLRDPYIMARRQALENQFLDSIQADPELAEHYGGLVDSLAVIQERKEELAGDFLALLALTTEEFTAAVAHRALWAIQWVILGRQGAPEEQLEELAESLLNVNDQPEELQELLLADRFRFFQDAYGENSTTVRSLLQGQSPEVAAAFYVQNSILSDSARTAAAVEAGDIPVSDPGIQMMNAMIQPLIAFQQRFFQLQDIEDELNSRLGRARFEVYGTAVPPDATFSLRIADGVVRGYDYNGTVAPPYTTYYGLYDHYHSYGRGEGRGSEWDLTARWLSHPASFDLSTPVNLVATSDIIGGNSGSPMLNRNLEVVGLVFDGNIESLPGDYIYLPEKNRTVAVDARGILEALDEILDADRLVHELTTGELVPSEEEADAMASGR